MGCSQHNVYNCASVQKGISLAREAVGDGEKIKKASLKQFSWE